MEIPTLTWDDVDEYDNKDKDNFAFLQCNRNNGLSTDIVRFKVLNDVKIMLNKVDLEIKMYQDSGKTWYDIPDILRKRKTTLEHMLRNIFIMVNNSLALHQETWDKIGYCLHTLKTRYGFSFYAMYMSITNIQYKMFFDMITSLKDIVSLFEKYIEENSWFKQYVILDNWFYDGTEITQNDYDDAVFLDKIVSKCLDDKNSIIGNMYDDGNLISSFDMYCDLDNKCIGTLRTYEERVFALCGKFKFSPEVELIHLHNYLSFIKDKYVSIRDNVPLNKYVFEKNLSYKPEIDYFYEEQKQDFGVDLIDLNALNF